MTDPADRLEEAMDDLYRGHHVHVESWEADVYIRRHAAKCDMPTVIWTEDGGYTVERVGEKPVRRGA
jgi:hypothetical protein